MLRMLPVVRAGWLALSFVLLLVCASCSREDFSLREEQSSVVVSVDIDASGSLLSVNHFLSLYVDVGSAIEPEELQFSVATPDGLANWEFFPVSIDFDGVRWLGYPSLSLGNGTPLPEGEWSLRLFLKDGRTIDRVFSVSYNEIDPALYPVFIVGEAPGGERRVVLTTSGARMSRIASLFDVPLALNDRLLSDISHESTDMLKNVVSEASLSEPRSPVPDTWAFELVDQTGTTLYQNEISLGSYTLEELGGESLWAKASALVVYRYIPESRITLVGRQRLFD